MMHVFAWDGESVHEFTHLDPAWTTQSTYSMLWVDVTDITPEIAASLASAFKLHELAVEDALAIVHHPKVESYPGVLYAILHGIDFEAAKHQFATHDVDFFVGANYLITVHDGVSRSIGRMRDICPRNVQIMSEGPAALMHRIVDGMVDNYRPEAEKIEARIDELERAVFDNTHRNLSQQILRVKRDVMALRRVVSPQRDVVGRIARREFTQIDEMVGYRFRDVYDHLVRLADEAMIFHDRLGGLLDAHLSFVSNRMNEVMKVLTVITTVFGPLTVIVGLYGMNVALPAFPGGASAQFWWIAGGMAACTVVMGAVFRSLKWF
ncbi:MAG: magnesium transporter CorA family protein [Acidobacteria bacterium]|jgi:magnesium transporter|nr:magnesium transporter CorA family protein [Acidobacteriota bacterium]